MTKITNDLKATSSGFTELRDKFKRATAHIGIIGMGYVGLPLAFAAV